MIGRFALAMFWVAPMGDVQAQRARVRLVARAEHVGALEAITVKTRPGQVFERARPPMFHGNDMIRLVGEVGIGFR